MVKRAQTAGERVFQTDDAEGRAVELAILLIRTVWGMVGGDASEGAVAQAFDQRRFVGVRPQGRVHFVDRVVVLQVGVRELDVVRAGFAAHGDAPGNGAAQDIDRVGGTHVLHVNVGPGEFG